MRIAFKITGAQVLSDEGSEIFFDSRWKHPEEFGFAKGTPEYKTVKHLYRERRHLGLQQVESIKKVFGATVDF